MNTQIKFSIYIGIDPGVQTGICVWGKQERKIIYLSSVKIHEAIDLIKTWLNVYRDQMFIIVEDARKRHWFGMKGREALQGAGSIKRDAKIWEDFLISIKANYIMRGPQAGATKYDAKRFKMVTGWYGTSNEHSRDAAMLVYGL